VTANALSTGNSVGIAEVLAVTETIFSKDELDQRIEERTRLLSESNEQLLLVETRLRSALDIETVGVFFFDPDGRLTFANDAFLAMGGYNREDIASGLLTWQALTPPEWMAISQLAFAELPATGRTTPYEKEYFRKDGSRFWALFAAKLLPDGTGCKFVIDISERKRAETAIRESEARFRALAHLVPDLLWSNDSTGLATWYNRRWLDYTGLALTDAQGYGWLDAVHPDDQARSLASFRTAIDTGTPLEQEYRIRARDGSYRWFLVRAEPSQDPHGNTLNWFGSATDIHEERTARDELAARVNAATAELHALSRQLLTVQEEERRHLARELHDEVGQALTGLQMQLEAVMRTTGAPLDEARTIVSELFQKVGELSMDLRPAALDTLGLLPALLHFVERYQVRTGVHVDLRVHGLDRRFPEPVEIAAYRVVQEALTNVARHAGIKRAAVQLFADADLLTVSIRDLGKGFDQASCRVGGGLRGMRERVELLDGKLFLEAATGAGVQIMAEFPIRSPYGRGHSGERA
jgi:PAS domain S-box-containing protein